MKKKTDGAWRPPARSGSAEETPLAGEDLLWGINPVWEMLEQNPGSVSEILIQQGKAGPRIQQIIDKARQHNVRLRFVAPGKLGVPASEKTQGVVARQSGARLLTLDELIMALGKERNSKPQRLLALDSIQDPHNMGAIFRTALAAGFDAVLITRERSAPVTGTVAKASAGAVSRLRICRVVNLAEALDLLKSHGFWIFGAQAAENAEPLYHTDFSVPLCLVIGGEGKGIRPLVQKKCDRLVKIPMHSGFDSLNASVAAGVFMFEIVRQDQAARSR